MSKPTGSHRDRAGVTVGQDDAAHRDAVANVRVGRDHRDELHAGETARIDDLRVQRWFHLGEQGWGKKQAHRHVRRVARGERVVAVGREHRRGLPVVGAKRHRDMDSHDGAGCQRLSSPPWRYPLGSMAPPVRA